MFCSGVSKTIYISILATVSFITAVLLLMMQLLLWLISADSWTLQHSLGSQMKCEKDFRPTEKRNVSVSIALQQSVVWCRWSAPEIIKLVISQLLLLPGLSQHLWWFIFLTSTLTIKLDTSYTQCLYFHFLFAFYCWFIKYKALWKMFFCEALQLCCCGVESVKIFEIMVHASKVYLHNIRAHNMCGARFNLILYSS